MYVWTLPPVFHPSDCYTTVLFTNLQLGFAVEHFLQGAVFEGFFRVGIASQMSSIDIYRRHRTLMSVTFQQLLNGLTGWIEIQFHYRVVHCQVGEELLHLLTPGTIRLGKHHYLLGRDHFFDPSPLGLGVGRWGRALAIGAETPGVEMLQKSAQIGKKKKKKLRVCSPER
jgi:hypothetical protein